MSIPTIRVHQGWLEGTVIQVGPVDSLLVRWDGGFERIVKDVEVAIVSGQEHIVPLRAERRARMHAAIVKGNKK